MKCSNSGSRGLQGVIVIVVIAIVVVVWPTAERTRMLTDARDASRNDEVVPRLNEKFKQRELALAERLKAANEISTDLSDKDLNGIIDFLNRPLEIETASNDLVAINQVMNQLRVSGLACGEYATALCGLIRKADTHPVVRDYAMQHAVQWIRESRIGSSSPALKSVDKQRLLDCIVAYIQEPTSLNETGFGTALNLARALEAESPSDSTRILDVCCERILSISAGKESSPLGNRIAAIQSLPFLGAHDETRAIVRELVNSAENDSPLKLVAIATLGKIGDRSDLGQLEEIINSDPTLAYAARSAASNLTKNILSPSR